MEQARRLALSAYDATFRALLSLVEERLGARSGHIILPLVNTLKDLTGTERPVHDLILMTVVQTLLSELGSGSCLLADSPRSEMRDNVSQSCFLPEMTALSTRITTPTLVSASMFVNLNFDAHCPHIGEAGWGGSLPCQTPGICKVSLSTEAHLQACLLEKRIWCCPKAMCDPISFLANWASQKHTRPH